MKLLFAQGNPGANYARTRHNAGFSVLDALAEAQNLPWKTVNKFAADIAELSILNEKVLLVKPRSFYNDTGRSARAIVDFYKVNPAHDLLVLHDDLALPFGTIRVRQKGSDAGNNGIKRLNSHLGDQYWRLRIGIWNERRDIMEAADFVLSQFTKAEQEALQKLVQHPILPLVERFIEGSLEHSSYTA